MMEKDFLGENKVKGNPCYEGGVASNPSKYIM